MQLIIAGRGGQGILLMTKVMGEAAFLSKLPVLSSETHGMALRGGTVITHLKIGPYRSPLIPCGSADVIIGMDEEEAKNHLHFIKRNGVVIFNVSNGSRNGFHAIDANRLATDLGDIRLSNMVLLGFAISRLDRLLSPGAVREAIHRVSPGSFLEKNLKAFELGFEKGAEHKKEQHGKGDDLEKLLFTSYLML